MQNAMHKIDCLAMFFVVLSGFLVSGFIFLIMKLLITLLEVPANC